MHDVKALIAPEATLRQMALEFKAAVVCPLVQNFALVPITDELAKELKARVVEPEESLRVPDMAAGVASLASRFSRAGTVAYVSTEYFGGAGGQDALVWRDGSVVFRAEDNEDWPNSPISQALRFLGVKATDGQDEFDTVQLGKHRSTEEWAETYAQA